MSTPAEIQAYGNAVRKLISIVDTSPVPGVRLAAIEGLGRAGGSAVLEKLFALADTSPIPDHRAAAARAIGEAVRGASA